MITGKCPRCGETKFGETTIGNDTWDSYSVTYYQCEGCELWCDSSGEWWFNTDDIYDGEKRDYESEQEGA